MRGEIDKLRAVVKEVLFRLAHGGLDLIQRVIQLVKHVRDDILRRRLRLRSHILEALNRAVDLVIEVAAKGPAISARQRDPARQ